MNAQERFELEKEIREKIKQEQRAYKAEWRRKNPDKDRASNERYWLKKAKSIMEKER